MRNGSTIVIGGTRYRWRDLVRLRQAQRDTARQRASSPRVIAL
jgi:hypothetical protein